MGEGGDSGEIRDLHVGDFLRLSRLDHWEFVSRIAATGAVSIVALTADDKIVLVEQYRYPLQGPVIELPAGVVGDEPEYEGEALETCAQRELIEETGYQAGSFSFLLTGPSSPGLTSELSNLLLATDLRRVGDGGGVGGENITVHVVPLEEIDAWLRKQGDSGRLVCPKVYSGLYFIRDRLPPC